MNQTNPPSKEIIARVSVHTELSIENLKKTYITKNVYGKDKSKMLNTLILGSKCAELKLTEKDIDMMMSVINTIREHNAK